MSARILVYGNAGSGKSTLAKRLAREMGMGAHLDLDTLVWEPRQIAVRRKAEAIARDLEAHLAGREAWVIEGVYGDLVEQIGGRCSELLFLHPGEEACVANCLSRQWEPHKYASMAEQERMLPFLLQWVRSYYARDDECSLARHQRIFNAFAGDKRELTKASES